MVDPIELYFESKSEHREWYTEHFSPADSGAKYAVLSLTVLVDTDPNTIIQEMEERCRWWYSKYPIPVMTMARHQSGTSTGIKDITGSHYLIGYSGGKNDAFTIHWDSEDNDFTEQAVYSNGELLSIYSDFPMKTGSELREKHTYDAKALKFFLFLSRLATIVVPAIWLIYEEFFSPNLLAYAILFFGICKYGRKLLQSIGILKMSEKERAASKKQRTESHYVYHCEMNPEGFERIKIENIKRLNKERENQRIQALLDKKDHADRRDDTARS